MITVIEGNKSDAVGRRQLQVGGRYIRAYGVPKYKNASVQAAHQKPKKSIDQLARETIAGRYGNGETRKRKLGSEYQAVQKRVNELLK